MTPTESMLLMALVLLAPHLKTGAANGYALICMAAAFIFWWLE